MRFAYTGAIYGGKRDLRPFFEAISEIVPSLKDANKKILFEYAGKEGDLFLSQAAEYNLHSYVVDHGQLSRLDALRLQQESDICLLATWNTSFEQGALTGKIFEYLRCGLPILALCPVNGALWKFLNKFNRIYKCSPSNTDQIEKEIEKAYKDVRPVDSGKTSKMLSIYNRKNLTGQLAIHLTQSLK